MLEPQPKKELSKNMQKWLTIKNDVKRKIIKFLAVLCCYDKERAENDEKISIRRVLFWRLAIWRQNATLF
jgi:hypothetical protein